MWLYDSKTGEKEFCDTRFLPPCRCVNPVYLKLPNFPHAMAFPCNKCPLCLQRRSLDWSNRIELESCAYSPEEVAFATLTYAPEYEPLIMTPSGYLTLDYTHIQLFLKRLRKRLDYKIRFFCCGEYGSLRGRPHFHLIIFGLKTTDYPYVKEAWNMGRVDCQVAGVKSFSYVAKYLVKLDELPKSDEQAMPMFRSSKGLGRDFVKEVCLSYQRGDIVEKNCFGELDIKPYMFLNGRKIVMPKYCITKLRQRFLTLEEQIKVSRSYLNASLDTFRRVVGTWFGLPTDRTECLNYISQKYFDYHYAKYRIVVDVKQRIIQKGWYDGD